MGPLLALFLVISLNMAPAGTQTIALDNFVVEGVGIYPDATRFVLTREESGWLLLNAQGQPWFTLNVDGAVMALDNNAGAVDQLDLGAALGLPAEEWWRDAIVEPPGLAPLHLTHLPDGFDVTLDGQLAAKVRW